MKKIFLTMAGIAALLHGYSQLSTNTGNFKPRKLKVEEINFVSSYYHQEGDNSAVTGGIGTQALTDYANVFDIRLVKYDKKKRKHNLTAEIGVDHYTSASSDLIDLKANSSASSSDTRIYPSLTWAITNEKKGTGFEAGVSHSSESDYKSYGVNIGGSKKTKNKNGELSIRLQAFFDRVTMFIPVELREPGNIPAPESRNSFAATVSYTQIINQRLQVAVISDVVKQSGFLSLPFYRVYQESGRVQREKLPGTRTKWPLGFRANYFAGDKVVIKSYYRFYTDDWGLRSHTIQLETPVKLSPFFSISPFYRFYNQEGSDYFAPYRGHAETAEYYTSNFDLSDFNSHFFGAGLRLSPLKGVLGWQRFQALELRYGHYTKNIDMRSDIVSIHIKLR